MGEGCTFLCTFFSSSQMVCDLENFSRSGLHTRHTAGLCHYFPCSSYFSPCISHSRNAVLWSSESPNSLTGNILSCAHFFTASSTCWYGLLRSDAPRSNAHCLHFVPLFIIVSSLISVGYIPCSVHRNLTHIRFVFSAPLEYLLVLLRRVGARLRGSFCQAAPAAHL